MANLLTHFILDSNAYEYNLGLTDYQALAEVMAELKGKAILSINDHPEMRAVFKRFTVRPVLREKSCW